MAKRNIEGTISDGYFDGFTVDTINLHNISDAYSNQTTEVSALVLTLLQTYDRTTLNEEEQLSYDIYQAHLENQLTWNTFQQFDYPATYGFFGWPGSTEVFFTQAFTLSNKHQAEIYLALLNQLGRRFEQIEQLLDNRKAAGVIEPEITLSYSRDLIDNIANQNATETSYYRSFDEQIAELTNISSIDKQALREALILTIEQRVLPAYQQLSQKMASLLTEAPVNIGFGQFEGGKEFYDFSLRFYTSSDLSSDEIHQLGITELSRIHDEMAVLFAQLGYPAGESIAQPFTRVDADAGIILAHNSKSFVEQIIAQTYTQLSEAFSTLPQQQVIVVGGTSGGYYIPGSDDGLRPGAFYANTSYNQAYTTMPTLTYHEALPGHHLQIALANELDLPLFRRKINVTSFVEGWALYAERLAKDLGWYENDVFGDLGRLQFEAMRAARLVIDTGIHNKGWSYDQADQFHLDNVGYSGSIARYSVWPGQATAYSTGMLKILALREMAQTQLGDLYNIKEFHTEIIGHGSMPLTLLEEVVERYIANKLSNSR